MIAGVTIALGDLIVANADGGVPRAAVDEVLADVGAHERREAVVLKAVESGASTLVALGLHDPPDDRSAPA